jgi:hypothetical protein
MENGPFIDGLPCLPIKNGDFPWQTVNLPDGNSNSYESQKTWSLALIVRHPRTFVSIGALRILAPQRTQLAALPL